MTKAKVLILVAGLLAVGAMVFAGAARITAAPCDGSGAKTASCDKQAKNASSCPAGAHARTAGTQGSCPMASAQAAGGPCKGSSVSCTTPCGGKAAKISGMEPVPGHEGERMVLVGHYVCTHCELGVSDSCQPAFQTNNGKNYLLLKNNLSNELHKSGEGKDAEIVTRVKKLDGVKYLQIEAIRSVS